MLNLTFEPGKIFMDSGFSRIHGGSVGGQNANFYDIMVTTFTK